MNDNLTSSLRLSSRLFSWQQIAVSLIVFLGITIVYQRSQRYVCTNIVNFDCPYYWPISIFNLRVPSARDLIVAAVVTALSFIFARYLEVKRFTLPAVALAGILLITGLTYIHGIDEGFYAPISSNAQGHVLVPYSANGQEYWHDAQTITNASDFLQNYNSIQPTLHPHGHTHPPGAVLTFYFLSKMLGDPALIALALMLGSTVLTVYFFRKLLIGRMEEKTANYLSFLLLLLPAVQIYYLATLDSLIAGLLTAVLYLFCFGQGKRAAVGAAACLAASFMLTFVSLFIIPVLAGFELIVKRSLKRSVIVFACVGSFYVLLWALSGYNALDAFRTASAFENPNGFIALADPVNYLFTRIEDVAEIVFFFGPFLTILCWRGLKDIRRRPLLVLTLLGCGVFGGMLASGAFRTGETSRACAFLFPYLLFPVGYFLEDTKIGKAERLQLAALVFLQSVGMQTLGNFHW